MVNTHKLENMSRYINEMQRFKAFEAKYVDGKTVIQSDVIPHSLHMESDLKKRLLAAVNKAAREALKQELEEAFVEIAGFIENEIAEARKKALSA